MRITKPALFDLPVQEQVDLFRAIMKNNGISHMALEVETEETFLARTLVELGLFPSTSQVRKNKPTLFRETTHGETVKVGRFNLTLRLSSVH